MKSKYINMEKCKDYEKIKEAAYSLKEGKLVLFPTETVYGIGANALDEQAVRKIFIAKGRAGDNPLIVHIAKTQMLDNLVEKVGVIEQILIKNFWPGPLTIIFNKKPIISNIITGGLDTVAIRMPSSEIARKLIEYSNLPIAAPSANVSGRPSGTVIEDILEELDGKVDYIIDGGKVEIGLESTVVRVIDDVVHILRPGKITKEDLEKLGLKVFVEKQILGEYDPTEKVMSPGIKYKHYAPKTKCLLVYSKNEEKLINTINKNIEGKNSVVICKTNNLIRYNTVHKLAMGNTLEEISRNIFTLLRKADKLDCELIVIEGVEKENLGLAIMNRLLRACSHNYIEL